MNGNGDFARPDMPGTTASAAPSATRLSGPWLVVARMSWGILFAGILVMFVTSLPGFRAGILSPTDNAALTPQAVEALLRVGITLDAYAWVSLGVLCVTVIGSVVFALMLFARRSDDWMVLLISLFVVLYPVANFAPTSATASTNSTLVEQAVGIAIFVPYNAIFYSPFLLFPTGRFVPRWSWALLIGWLVWIPTFGLIPPPLGILLAFGYPLFFGVAIACQTYRYRRASTPAQRQQTKWVIFGMILTLLVNQAFWLITWLTPLGQTLYAPLFFLVYQLVLLLLPVTFFIAIQRYRLFDIDVIIRRTLVYGVFSALLAGMYFGSVALLQQVARSINGQRQDSTLAIIISTLLIAALFQPLRRRVQQAIDRRFYRTKYDATRTMDRFATTLRQQVELDQLRAHLVEVVQETMQPASISIWLAPPREHGAGAPTMAPDHLATIPTHQQAAGEHISDAHRAPADRHEDNG